MGVPIERIAPQSAGPRDLAEPAFEFALMRLAAKLLASGEVSADVSNQHEFNGGELRRALELPKERTSASLELTYLPQDDDDPVGEICGYTVYNAREGKPRSAEYRFYFDSTQLQQIAHAGDILIVIRPTDGFDLKALIVPAASPLGNDLARILAEEGLDLSGRFQEITAVFRAADLEHLLADASEDAVLDDESLLALANPELIASALSEGRLPSTRTMAEEAGRMMARAFPGPVDADTELDVRLRSETTLFRYLDRTISQQSLDKLASAGRIMADDAVKLVLSQLQSRKSRRGQSLQNHFQVLLDRNDIAYGAQCQLARGDRPDFVFPGCAEYLDHEFPDSRLRMVACKSTLKERWPQVLNEGHRIRRKYILTLDTELTDSVVDRMEAGDLYTFLPERILLESYANRSASAKLGTVSRLLELLETAQRSQRAEA